MTKGLQEGMTDEGLRALAAVGCGEQLTELTLFSEWKVHVGAFDERALSLLDLRLFSANVQGSQRG